VQTYLFTLVIVALAMLAMALGVMVSGRRLRGSCGRGSDCACTRAERRRCPHVHTGGGPDRAAGPAA
jgi:hypothetical protein